MLKQCPRCGADDYDTYKNHWADGYKFEPFCECRCGATWDPESESEDKPQGENQMNDQQLAAVKQALEALTVLLDEWTPARQAQLKGMEAVTALQSIISQDAMHRLAKNARDLGLDYEPAPLQEPSFKEWTQDYVRDNIHKLKSTPPAAQPAEECAAILYRDHNENPWVHVIQKDLPSGTKLVAITKGQP